MKWLPLVILCIGWSNISGQTNGPVQPEFTKFESVTTSNMVDLFSGDFTYNIPVLKIPGPNGLDYSLSLSYHSGTSPQEDASWVGYGWTLNPGSIVRNKRGYPDDVDGGEVTMINEVPANTTVGLSAGLSVSPEAASIDFVDVGLDFTLAYNTYKHLYAEAIPSVGVNIGLASLNAFYENGNLFYTGSLNPAEILADATTTKENNTTIKSAIGKWTSPYTDENENELTSAFNFSLNQFGRNSFFLNKMNTAFQSYTGSAFKVNVEIGASFLPLPSGVHFGTLSGFYNTQKPLEQENLTYYGYLYSHHASAPDLMDYFTEKDFPFTKKEKYLGIPISNPDYFNITGEGIGGSFRFFNKNASHFWPNAKSNTTPIESIGFEGLLGGDMDFGIDGNSQDQKLDISEWYTGSTYKFSHDEDEAYFIKFSSDLGSIMDFGNDGLQRMDIESEGSTFTGIKSFDVKISGLDEEVNKGERIQRSAYITYNTHKEINGTEIGGVAYRNYDRFSSGSLVDHAEPGIEDGIAEFIVFDKSGARYLYGLPVYSCNEESISVAVEGDISAPQKVVSGDVETPAKRVGQINAQPYAATYLLTEITSPDYIDLNLDGPTSDDIGEYIRFEYKRKFGTTNKANLSEEDLKSWYHWRIPYSGLLYEPGEFADTEDDMGSYTSGDKELYYLQSISTKTHRAEFKTSERKDGFDANHNRNEAAQVGATGDNRPEKLDEIVLYAIGRETPDIVLQRTYFKYDYSLAPGTPNSEDGKLTLIKLWTEFMDVYPEKTSPYKFCYSYPEDGYYPMEYDALDNYGSFSTDQQNPVYTEYDTDAWGFYQTDGQPKFEEYSNSVDQNVNIEFDPAAYHLKNIQLPSAGEIHIQYEQDDYSYVQNRSAQVMVPFKPGSDETVNGDKDDKFYLNLDAIGVTDPDLNELEELKAIILDAYGDRRERVYFNFLYNLISTTDFCYPQYIEGYAFLKNVGIEEGKLYIQLDEGTGDITPRKLCKEYYQTNWMGRADLDECSPNLFNMSEDEEDAVYALLGISGQLINLLDEFVNTDKACAYIDLEKSYFRLPVGKSKKGGGVRVKRLLSWDDGLEKDTVLYGNEFIYRDSIGISTGVATNEPSELGGENALVTFLDRNEDYNFVEKLIRGGEKDLSQYRGPLYESLLPAPSVGYANIISRNIWPGKTNTGITITEYNTSKDYAFDDYNVELDQNNITYTDILQEKDYAYITSIINTKIVSSFWTSQGYKMVQNDMHGKIKSVSTYQGDYDDCFFPDSLSLVSQQTYSYSQPGEYLTVMNDWGEYENIQIGKEEEVIFESRKISDVTNDIKYEFDANVVIVVVAVIPIPTVMLYRQNTTNLLCTHVTNKMIKYPSLLKSTTTYKDGVYSITENVVFDKFTGDPLITKSYDSFDSLQLSSGDYHKGHYLNYQIPSTYYYDAMGPKSKSDRKQFVSGGTLTITRNSNEYLEFEGDDACESVSLFTPGDWILISGKNASSETIVEIYYADEQSANILYIDSHPNFPGSADDLTEVSIEIIRTARSNQLMSPASNIVTYGASLDDYKVDYDPLLSERVQFATALNALVGECKATGLAVSGVLELPCGRESAGNCYDNASELTVSLTPISPDGDEILICVPGVDEDDGRIEFEWEKMLLSDDDYFPRLTLIKPKPAFRIDKNLLSDRFHNSIQDSISVGLRDPVSPIDPDAGELSMICQCDTNIVQLTNLEDAATGMYTLSTDTIYAYSPSGYYFRFPVEEGDSILDKYVVVDTFCTSYLGIDKNVLIHNSKFVLFDQELYEPDKVNKVCFNFCDDHTLRDTLYIESSVPPIKIGVNRIQDLVYDFPPVHIDVYYGPIDATHTGGRVEIYQEDGLCFEKITLFSEGLIIDDIQYCVDTVEASEAPDLCCDTISANGYFKIDSLNGELVYYENGACASFILECINFCPNMYPKAKLRNVISASEKVFSSNWSHEDDLLHHYYVYPAGESPYHQGYKGFWRPWFNANYKENIHGLYNSTDRIYGSGYFDELTLFNHLYHEANLTSKWIPNGEILLISPDGNNVLNENPLDINFSSMQDLYSNLPVYNAANATHEEMSYSSVDSDLDYQHASGTPEYINDVSSEFVTSNSDISHSGSYSLKVDSEEDCLSVQYSTGDTVEIDSDPGTVICWREGLVELRPFTLTAHGFREGLLISVWVHTTRSEAETSLKLGEHSKQFTEISFERIAVSGEWMLYEVLIQEFGEVSIGDEFIPQLIFYNGDETVDFYVDDIRVQPADAQVTCHVYDPARRLAVTYDNDHFGTYYLYDQEGRLNKKKIETERGVFVVQENYYNSVKN